MYNNEFWVYFPNTYQRISQEIKTFTTCSLTFQTMPIQPKGTRIAGTSYGEAPYAHIAIDTIEVGRIRVFRGQKYDYINYVLCAVCLHTGHISLTLIPNVKSESVARAISSVELRFNVRILRVYSDNHTALREGSLGPEKRKFKDRGRA